MLHAGGYGGRAARRLLRRHGGASEAEADAGNGDSAPPHVAGIADGGTGHELCSTGVLLRLLTRALTLTLTLALTVTRPAAAAARAPLPARQAAR